MYAQLLWQRYGLVCRLLTGVLLFPLISFAQDEMIDEDAVDEIVVTGTHIKGLSEEALPVTVVGEEAIRDLGAVNMFDLLAYIPSISDFEFEDNANGTNAVRGDVAGVNMRSLGTGNTLVLIDGRRMVVHPTFQAINSVPATLYNANSMPSPAIQRIEVLRDGASAVYGADASAGVVNFITRRGDEGIELSGKYGASSANAYDETELTARGGWSFNGDATSVGVFGTFYQRSDVHISELGDLYFNLDRRNHPAIPEAWQGDSQLRNDSTRSAYAQVRIGALNQDLQFIGGTSHVDPATGALVSGSSSERYNFNETAWVTPKVDRFNMMVTLDHSFANGMELFGDVTYYDSSSNTQRAASPIDDGLAFLIVPSTGFYNPTGEDMLVTRWRPIDLGPRIIDVDQNTYRILAGLRGDWGNWGWESALVHSGAEAVDIEGNRQAKSLFVQQAGLATSEALNVLARPGELSEASLDAIRISSRDVRESEVTLWDLRLNNDELFSLPGGGAGFAAGIEYRRDYFKDDRDPRLDGSQPFQDGPIFDESDIIGMSATFDSSASRNTASLYGEVFMPFVSDQNEKTLIKALELQLAVRYEDTNDFGDTTKPKVMGRWAPFNGFSLRASYSEGFRAPNLPQLNQGTIVRRLIGIEDPLREEVTQLPIDTGDTYRKTTRLSNSELQPEDTETTMIGFAIAPKDGPLSGLTVTYDWFNIKQDGVVGILSPDDALALDDLLRSQGSSNPNVERAPVTAADQAAFDAWNLANPTDQRTPVGVATNIINQYINLDPREVEGWDAMIEYRTPDTRAGAFTFRAEGTRLTKFEQLGLAQTDLLRRNGNPEWRATAGIRWAMNAMRASLTMRYVDSVYDTSLWQSGVVSPGIYDPDLDRTYWKVESWTVYNLAFTYDFAGRAGALGGLRLNLGVRNLTDEKPPFADESFGYLSRLHNPYGRVVWGQLSYTFE